MFTGLIQRIGTVKRVSRGTGLVLEISADTPWTKPLEEGESIAVNGVCLTVVKHDGFQRFTADVLRETEIRSGLGELVPGTKVNLERALRVGEPMGGHIVQGHVECRGTVSAIEPKGRDIQLRVRCGRVLAAESVIKGSITINGVSLTISAIGEDFLGVDLIPTTRKDTNLGLLRVGDKVNLEGDVLRKYAAKGTVPAVGLNEESLAKAFG